MLLKPCTSQGKQGRNRNQPPKIKTQNIPRDDQNSCGVEQRESQFSRDRRYVFAPPSNHEFDAFDPKTNDPESGEPGPRGTIRFNVRPSASMIKLAGVNMRVRRRKATAESAAASASIPSSAGAPIWRSIRPVNLSPARLTR